MSTSPQKPRVKRVDDRWPVMPNDKDTIDQPTKPHRPSAREKNRPVNGPAIDEWEAALVGRQMIKPNAAYTISHHEADEFPSVASVRGALLFCINHADGALARIPVEIVRRIEQILHETVCPITSNKGFFAPSSIVTCADSVIVRTDSQGMRPPRKHTILSWHNGWQK